MLIVNIEPVPLGMPPPISSHLVQFDLPFMVAAVYELGVVCLASLMPKHAAVTAAILVGQPCLPAFATGYFVCFHFQSVLLDTAEDVQSPVIPHWRASLYDVVWFWAQLR